jgi:hypothetical protein
VKINAIPCEGSCKPIPRISKKCVSGPACSRGRVSKKKGTVTFSKECITGKNVPTVTIDCSKKVKSRSIAYLNDGVRLKINILNKPALLLKIREFAEEKFGKKICLYVDSKSRVFVLFRGTLYQVCRTGSDLSIRKLNNKQKLKVESKGLYNVILH